MRGNKEIKIFCHGPISRLTEDMVVEILVRISSVKTIALCKSVCKSWRGLISGPRFAELHLARSKICVLVRNMEKERTLRTVWLLEDEDGRRGFHTQQRMCSPGTEMDSCEICRSDTTAVTKLKIPVGMMSVGTIGNTCDGLLCLYSSSVAVCNPLTGEFVTLPNRDIYGSCGLGLDPKTGQYKVVMLYPGQTPNSETLAVLKVEVFVLGTDSWRELDTPEVILDLRHLRSPVLLGGALYWVYKDRSSDTSGMVSFDLGSERLCYHSLPSLPPHNGEVTTDLTVVALGDRLCAYLCYLNGKRDMCFVSDSSPEWISHDLSGIKAYVQPIRRLDDESLLMFNFFRNEFICSDSARGGRRFKRLRFAGDDLVEVLAYTPSFLSLKDIVRPRNAEVLNVYSVI